MIQSINLYRQPRSINSQEDVASQYTQISLPPNINRAQLKQIIIAKYQKEFNNNSKYMQSVKEIIDKTFENHRHIDDELLRNIKTQITEKVGRPLMKKVVNGGQRLSYSMTPKVQGKAAPLVLPRINQSTVIQGNLPKHNQSQPNITQTYDNKTDRPYIMDNNEKDDTTFQNNKEKKNISKKDINIKKNSQQTSKQMKEQQQNNISIPITSQQLLQTENGKGISKNDEIEIESPRSVYQIDTGDEWTALLQKDLQLHQREQEQKIMKKKLYQEEIKEALEKQVKLQKVSKNKIKKEIQQLESSLAQQWISKFDQQEQQKQKKLQERVNEVESERKRQIELKKKAKIEQYNKIAGINESILSVAKNEHDKMEQQKRQRKIDEYNFYSQVKKEDEKYKESLKSSSLNTDPSNIFFQKNYGNISGDYSGVYNKSRKTNNIGLSEHFENNKMLREQQQQLRYHKIEEMVKPLEGNFKILDLQQEKKEEKNHYQNIFAENERIINQEKLDAFNKKMRHRREINEELDVQLQEAQQKKQEFKKVKEEQGQMWRMDTENYQKVQKLKQDQKKQANLELREFLARQIEDKQKKKQQGRRMNEEELLLNKGELKDMFSGSNLNASPFHKNTITSYHHIRKQL